MSQETPRPADVPASEGASAPAAAEGENLEGVEVHARQYLEETVVHVLLQGLKTLNRERPANPVDFLAMYLLKKNPNKSCTVEVPMGSIAPQTA